MSQHDGSNAEVRDRASQMAALDTRRAANRRIVPGANSVPFKKRGDTKKVDGLKPKSFVIE
jgi:hypothetical protein